MTLLQVFYDGACPLCRREIAFMRRLDRGRAIQFMDVSTETGSCPMDRAQLLARFHALENGQMKSGAEAFTAVWRAIPALRPFGVAARIPFVLRDLERAYLLFLRARPSLQTALNRLERPGAAR